MHYGLPINVKIHRDSFPYNPFSPAVAAASVASVRFAVAGIAAEAVAAFEEVFESIALANSLLGPEVLAVEAVASVAGIALSALSVVPVLADIHYFAALPAELEHFEVLAVRQAAVAADIPVDSPAVGVVAVQQVSAVQTLAPDLAAPALLEGDYLADAVETQV